MTEQQRETVAGMLRASPFDPAGDLREQRPLFDKMIAAAPVPADVVITPGQLGGVPVIRVDVPGTTTDGVILSFHGGFFAIGSAATSVGLASDLARQARIPVVTVDYRLAPEHPYPAAPHDTMTAHQGLLDLGQDAARLALAGESAGANLVLVTLAVIQRVRLPQPTSGVLMSPGADLAGWARGVQAMAQRRPSPADPRYAFLRRCRPDRRRALPGDPVEGGRDRQRRLSRLVPGRCRPHGCYHWHRHRPDRGRVIRRVLAECRQPVFHAADRR